VVQTNKGQSLWLTASRADLVFRSRLRSALPTVETKVRPTTPPDGDELSQTVENTS
jgi:CRISPR system Cascade subunit CasA